MDKVAAVAAAASAAVFTKSRREEVAPPATLRSSCIANSPLNQSKNGKLFTFCPLSPVRRGEGEDHWAAVPSKRNRRNRDDSQCFIRPFSKVVIRAAAPGIFSIMAIPFSGPRMLAAVAAQSLVQALDASTVT